MDKRNKPSLGTMIKASIAVVVFHYLLAFGACHMARACGLSHAFLRQDGNFRHHPKATGTDGTAA